ncbi:MAG: dTDP-4-dehydrorhamnose reductase [Pseudohongiellaceae bacterium]|nr:dTDP-4-dehydrorhamnose reductase [Pseudohongiellaceae bacterium]
MTQAKGKTIAICGAGGQLGQALRESDLAQDYTLLCFDRAALDISDPQQVAKALDAPRPDIIINAAAYTAVDKAESEPELAFAINENGAQNLAMWASANDAHLVHISTDFVFDGCAHSPYRVNDELNPLSVYGKSKLAGEQQVIKILGGQASIVRTAWLYSATGNNFVNTMLRLMRERDILTIVDDQIGTPCSTRSLARFISALLSGDLRGGIHHWTDAGAASWYDFAVAIYHEAMAQGLLSKEVQITPIPASQFPTPATRPSYSVLDKHETLSKIDCAQKHWREELREVLVELSSN